MLVRHAVIAFALLTCAHSAQAHGIAGNRFFVGTLTIDDPVVADEAILPGYTGLGHPGEAEANPSANPVPRCLCRAGISPNAMKSPDRPQRQRLKFRIQIEFERWVRATLLAIDAL
jgi:hypothetical protein